MTLPFSEEIRDARARSEKAQAAVMFHKRVQTAAHAVSIIQQQVSSGKAAEEVVAALSERY